MAECPEPGIYPGVKYGLYKTWDALNVSTLCEGLQSMRRMKAKLDKKLPDKDSDTLRFGRAVHCQLLEPELFPTSFPLVEKCVQPVPGKKKSDPSKPCKNYGTFIRDDGEWLCGVHASGDEFKPADYVTPEEFARIERLREFVLRDPTLSKLHRHKGSECCFVTDLCGVRVKGRIDKLIQTPSRNMVVDLKTVSAGKLSTAGAEDRFARDRIDLNYHTKLAFYCDSIEKLTGLPTEGCWGVIEADEPFEVGTVPFDDEERKLGRSIYQDALDRVRESQESGEWRGAYESGPMFSPLPQWYWRQFQHSLPQEIR